jgi:hypothetical protein
MALRLCDRIAGNGRHRGPVAELSEFQLAGMLRAQLVVLAYEAGLVLPPAASAA